MKIFAANWKLNKTPNEARSFFKDFLPLVKKNGDRKLVFFPATASLEAAAQSLKNSGHEFGSQNCYWEAKGAFTGEVSAQTVQDLGGTFVLVGHSERRKLFFETDEMCAKKVQFVQAMGLIPMLCIGETLAEREAQRTKAILEGQLEKGLSLANKSSSVVIAYEPVWAIGTGRIANNEQVREAHEQIYQCLLRLGFSSSTPILYGGSVKADNSKELLAIAHVDGFLVGGASLEPKSFSDICHA